MKVGGEFLDGSLPKVSTLGAFAFKTNLGVWAYSTMTNGDYPDAER